MALFAPVDATATIVSLLSLLQIAARNNQRALSRNICDTSAAFAHPQLSKLTHEGSSPRCHCSRALAPQQRGCSGTTIVIALSMALFAPVDANDCSFIVVSVAGDRWTTISQPLAGNICETTTCICWGLSKRIHERAEVAAAIFTDSWLFVPEALVA